MNVKKVFFALAVIAVWLCSISICAIAQQYGTNEPSDLIATSNTNSTLNKAAEDSTDFDRYREFGFSSKKEFKEWLENPVEATASSNRIILSHENAVLQVGKTLQLSATTVPAGKTITWTVIQNDLASVTSTGLVTAKAVGDAYVIARCEELGLNVPCHIQIMDINLDATLSVYYGERGRLSAYQQPYSDALTVSWEALTSGFTVTPEIGTNSASVSYSGIGTGRIKAYITEHPEIYKVCAVSFIPKIRLTKASFTATVGDTISLNAIVTPSQYNSVLWTSFDTSIATVNSSGVVTIKALGRVNIKATVRGYSNAFTICTITVKEQPVTGISLPETLQVTSGTQHQLQATISPSNATNKGVRWSSDSIAVAVDQNGLLTIYGPADATITATSAENNSIVATCRVYALPNSASGSTTINCLFPLTSGDYVPGYTGVSVDVSHDILYTSQPFYNPPTGTLGRGAYVTNNIFCAIIQNFPTNPNTRVSVIGEYASYTNGTNSASFSAPASSSYVPWWHGHFNVTPYYRKCGGWGGIRSLSNGNSITVTYGGVVSCSESAAPYPFERTYTFTPDISSSLFK